jgi:hypothetical protein
MQTKLSAVKDIFNDQSLKGLRFSHNPLQLLFFQVDILHRLKILRLSGWWFFTSPHPTFILSWHPLSMV